MATPDDDLISACRQNDREAWNELVGRYHRLVRSIARSYGLRDHDVDEIVQLVFSVVVKQLDRFQPGTRLAPWLAVVTRRHVWRTLEHRRRVVPVDDAGRDQSHREVDEHADRHADSEWLRSGLDRLAPRCRTLLEALYLSGERSYEEVAENLGIPIGSIGPTRSRCLEQLRQLLASTSAAGAGGAR